MSLSAFQKFCCHAGEHEVLTMLDALFSELYVSMFARDDLFLELSVSLVCLSMTLISLNLLFVCLSVQAVTDSHVILCHLCTPLSVKF